MKSKMVFIVAVGIAMVSCSKARDSDTSDKISGVYVAEYSFKVINPETSNEAGMRTMRDTIYIQPADNGFQISNKKWALNDYDKEGWRSAEHSEDRPWPTYKATFSESDATLNSDPAGLAHTLYINLAKRTVSKSKDEKQIYRKAR